MLAFGVVFPPNTTHFFASRGNERNKGSCDHVEANGTIYPLHIPGLTLSMNFPDLSARVYDGFTVEHAQPDAAALFTFCRTSMYEASFGQDRGPTRSLRPQRSCLIPRISPRRHRRCCPPRRLTRTGMVICMTVATGQRIVVHKLLETTR